MVRQAMWLCWVEILWSTLLFCCISLVTVLVVWPYMWIFTFSNIRMFPLIFLGSTILLLWIWKKLSDPQHLSLNSTELLILGGGLLVIIGTSLYVVNSVLAGMYDAFTVAHELPKLFLGDIRYDIGSLYYPMIWFVWSAPLTLPLIGLAIYLTIELSLLAKKIARYLIIFLPALSLLATMGAIKLSQLFALRR